MSSRFVIRSFFALVVGCSLTVISCKEEKKTPPPKPAPAPAKWKVDESLLGVLSEVSKECDVDTERAQVRCKQDERRTLLREFVSGKRSRLAALETLVFALEKDDKKLQIATADLLYEIGRGDLGDEARKGAVSPKVAAGLREVMVSLPPLVGRLVAPMAAHASALSGELDALFQVLDKNPELAAAAYRFVMVHGRLDAFEQVRSLTKNPHPAVRLAAVEAPRHMQKWTPKDRAQICPWARELLDDERPLLPDRAATLLSRCTGEHVDALLDRGEAEANEHNLSRGLIPAFRDLCSGTRRRAGGGATREQCERNEKLLREVVEDAKSEDQTRALALSAIAYQWPSQSTLTFAKRFQNASAAPRLSAQAEGTVSRLGNRLSKESSGTNAGTAAGATPAVARGVSAPGPKVDPAN